MKSVRHEINTVVPLDLLRDNTVLPVDTTTAFIPNKGAKL